STISLGDAFVSGDGEVVYTRAEMTGSQKVAAILHFVISNDGTSDSLSLAANQLTVPGDDPVIHDFVIDGAYAYVVAEYKDGNGSNVVFLERMTVTVGTGDMTRASSQTISGSFDNIEGVSLHIDQAGDTGYLLVKSFASAS